MVEGARLESVWWPKGYSRVRIPTSPFDFESHFRDSKSKSKAGIRSQAERHWFERGWPASEEA